MNKSFYKLKNPPKMFFDRSVVHRTYAYGEGVRGALIAWQRHFADLRAINPDKCILSAQRGIYRADTPAPESDSVLPHLYFDSLRLTVGADGFVHVNGGKGGTYLGTDLKAWAILTLSEPLQKCSYLCVIAGREGDGAQALSLYPLTRRGPEPTATMRVELEQSHFAASHLVCFGRHVFLVHNGKMNYLYFNAEHSVIEEVPIGADAPNAKAAHCRHVQPVIVTDTHGSFYWIANETVYSVQCGHPRALITLPAPVYEQTLEIAGGENAVYVKRRNKNTSAITTYRYVRTPDGAYECSAVTGKSPFGN